ncbi:hypothetical protein ACIQC5_07120 [Paenarthrobacter sp. NPDC092416]|uniref:hypothetical protein n=1 Tax=Paenarthrobacter sp. NPDC092416 TaxID=3364386 RepID=UPI0037F5D5C8
MSNPQEPYQPGQNPGYGQPGQNPPPVPPGPGYPQTNPAPPQWQQPPSSVDPQYAAPQTGAPQYGAQQYGNPQYSGPGQNPPGQYLPGQYPPGPPPRKSKKVLWIVLSIIAGVIVLAVVGILVLVNVVGGATSKARTLADEFTTLVVQGKTEEAYDNYLHQALKDELDKQSFVDGIASLELDSSCKPNYNSVSVNSENGNNTADLSGTLQCSGKNIELKYVFEGTDDLKMSSIRLRP